MTIKTDHPKKVPSAGFSQIEKAAGNRIKALFFDIDGTLVSMETHIIPPSTVQALEEAHRKGIKIFISTGRPVSLINNIGPVEHLISGYITTNGARSHVGDRTLALRPLDREDTDTVLRNAHDMDYAVLVVSEFDTMVYNYKPYVEEIFDTILNIHDLKIDAPIEPFLETGILQLTPFINEEQEARLIPMLKNAIATRWYPLFVDVVSANADKARGMKDIAEEFGFAIEECMAFGDGGNDIEIIREAGIGVAMGNARERVKAAADYVTSDCDDDGVYNALKHFKII